MDSSEGVGLQFLDLSEIDEHERNRILTTLSSCKHKAKFPWFIGIKHGASSKNKSEIKSSFIPNALTNVDNMAPRTRKICPQTGKHINDCLENTFPSSQPFCSYKYYPSSTVSYIPAQDQTKPLENFDSTNLYLSDTKHANYSIPPIQAIHSNTLESNEYQNNASISYHITNGENLTQVISSKEPSYRTQTNTVLDKNSLKAENIEEQSHSVLVHHSSSDYYSSKYPVSKKTPNREKSLDHIKSPVDIQNESLESVSGTSTNNSLVVPDNAANSTVISPTNPIKVERSPEGGGGKKLWSSLFESKGSSIDNTQNMRSQPLLEDSNAEGTIIDKDSSQILRKSQFIDPDCYRIGEYLLSYTIDGRAVSLQPRGLINQSNYCYINSILQALIACPPMYNLLSGLSRNISSNQKRKPTPVIDGLCRFVKEFNHLPASMRVNNRRSENGKKEPKKDQEILINTDIPFEPSWIYKMLNGIHTNLVEGRQEDAEEFLGYLLNNLNDEMLEVIKLIKNEESSNNGISNISADEDENWQVMGTKNKGSIRRKTFFEKTPITEIFGGSLKSRIHRTGDHDTENTQPFFTLQLNIEKVATVREALEALTAKHKLEGVTSFKTNEEVEAWQQVTLDELPIVLILHLKCFDFKLDGCTKILKALEFPIDLKLDGKLISTRTNNTKEKQYKLFAVVYHDGREATKGHYITDAFHVGYSSWLRYDDAAVRQVPEEQVLNPQGTRVPYLLFYRRCDTIRSK